MPQGGFFPEHTKTELEPCRIGNFRDVDYLRLELADKFRPPLYACISEQETVGPTIIYYFYLVSIIFHHIPTKSFFADRPFRQSPRYSEIKKLLKDLRMNLPDSELQKYVFLSFDDLKRSNLFFYSSHNKLTGT